MEELEKYTINELQVLLRERGLPLTYRKKQDLIDRLKTVIGENSENESENTSGNSESNVHEDSTDTSTEVESQDAEEDTIFMTEKGQLNSKPKSDPSGSQRHSKVMIGKMKDDLSMTEGKDTLANNFVFKDVEDSLETFNGESGKGIASWLKDFNDIATVCSWNDMQKYLYARRLLRGAAKLAIEASTGVHSWGQLKSTLFREFEVAPTSLSVHRSLETRKKAQTETFLEYIYAMKQIANRGSVDEESLVTYIAAGITDDVHNKAILYDAKTLDELKQKIKVYETIKMQQKPLAPNKRNFKTGNSKEKNGQNWQRCFNCGSKSHLTGSCPNKSKGARCFRCGNFGHMSSSCPQSKTLTPGTSYVNENASKSQVNTITIPDLSVWVKFGEGEYKALVDTGSGVTLVRESIVRRSKVRTLNKGPSIFLTGFGQSLKRTHGSISATFNINGDKYDVRCHIVPDDWISKDILIGADVIKRAKLLIEEGTLTITKVERTEPEEGIDFLNQINVVQLMEELKYDSLEEIQHITYRDEIRKVIDEYSPRKPDESCIKMEILLEDDTPIYFKPRRLAPKEKEVVSKQISQWLEEGIIRPSCSSFGSPVVLVKKKDGDFRLCIDYRKLNKKIVKDRYPLPVMEDILEDLHQAAVFTTLDLRNGFFHVDIDEASRKFTAFLTTDGQFEFNKVPFGLCNSPAVFQRFVNTVFQPLIMDKTLMLYMDDIIIPARDEAENLEKLKKTLTLAESHGLVIKWSKCKFLKRSVEFLGHIVGQGSIRPSKEKTAAVRNFPAPHNVKEVQSFLGLTGFFRKFVPNYSVIARPLTDLLKKSASFRFGQEEQDAFNILKERLSTEPVLKLFNPELETQLHTDASKVGLGAVLLQKHLDSGKFHPVFYLSFKTSSAEQKYSSYELEVLAIIKSLRKLRHYLLGLKFVIYTDCKAFELTMRKKEISSRVARWALQLEEFDCKVQHRSGCTMRHVDALSRYPSVFSIENETLLRVKKAQEADDFCRLTKKCLEQGTYENFLLRNDILYKFVDGNYLLVVPKTLQKAIISNIHEQGHLNARKIEALIRQEYYIPNLMKKMQGILQNCVACILASRKAGRPEGFLNPIEKLDQPLHTYHVDHLGPLQSTAKSYKYLFVVIDAFTKFSWIYPVKSTTADETIRKLDLQSEVFGDPSRIVTDRGTAFTSSAFRSYCEERKINQVFITTGVPRGNGQVERLNQIIISVLSKISVAEPSKWYKHVPQLQKILNSSCNRSTGKTPFQLMFGVKMSRPEQHELAKVVEEEIISVFEGQRSILREEAKKQISKVQEENRRYSERKRKPALKYKIGDLVAIKRTQFNPGGKLFPKFLGPYEVVSVKGNDRYDVRKIGGHEGPNISNSAADYMKPWRNLSEDEDSSGTDEEQDGRMWEPGI